MALTIDQIGMPAGRSLYAFIRKVSPAGVEGDVWNNSTAQWVAGPAVPLAGDAEQIALAAGTGVEAGRYTGATSADLGTYTGLIRVNIVDTTLNPDLSLGFAEIPVRNGKEFHGVESRDQVTITRGVEKNRAQTLAVRLRDQVTGDFLTSDTVTATEIAAAATSPSYAAATNPATYSGAPGIYLVSLTAAELNVSTPRLIRVTTTNGTGISLLMVDKRQIETDWTDGGRLDLILDAIWSDTNTIVNDVSTNAALIGQVADNVWDEAISGHVGAGTAGNLLERLDLIAAGGAGELTAARMTALDATGTNAAAAATPAEVKTQVDQALVDIHLDHLLAAAYDPAAKPGSATGYLNVLVENDAGTPRFTTNSLELAPTGTGAATPSAIADAVWDELTSGHAVVGSFAKAITDIDAETQSITNTTDTTNTTVDGINAYVVGTLTTKVDANATPAEVSTQLAAIGLDHLVAAAVTGADIVDNSIIAKLVSKEATADWDDFVNTTDSLQAIRDRGDAAWATGAGGSAPTAADIRAEIDSNSTQLAAIVADTNALQVDWADGGRLDLILDAIPTGNTAAAIRAEIDSNSTQLAAIVADTNALQVDWTDGGRLDLIADAILADTTAILVDTNFNQTTLDAGGTIHTLISAIQPNPNALSPETIDDSRTWIAPPESDVARNYVIALQGDAATYAMDFTQILNPDTGIGTADSVTLADGDADLTFGTPRVDQRHQEIHCAISGQLSGKRYKLRFACTTTDGDTISRHGWLVVT